MGVQTQLTEKNSDNLELDLLQYFTVFSGGPMVYFKENYCLPRFQRVAIVFQGGGGGLFSVYI